MTKSSIKSALRPKAKRAEIIRLASEGWLPSPVHNSCNLADFGVSVAEAEKTVPQLPTPFRIPDPEKATGPFCSPGLISGRNSGIINTADEESIMSEVTEMNGDFENSELFNQLPEELKEFFDQLPDETKEKLRNCKSEEEVMEVLNEDMVPIPDDALDTVAGGWEYCNHSCARYRTDDWGDED